MGGKDKPNPKVQLLIFIVKALTLAIWFATLVSFLLAKPGAQNKNVLTYLLTGSTQLKLTEMEMLHMQDVRTWFLVLELASFVWVIPQDVYPGRRTSVIILLLTLGFVTITLLRFDTVWNYMHHVLFRNQLWILPIDSYLIEHFFDTFFPAVVSGFGIWILLWLKTLLPVSSFSNSKM